MANEVADGVTGVNAHGYWDELADEESCLGGDELMPGADANEAQHGEAVGLNAHGEPLGFALPELPEGQAVDEMVLQAYADAVQELNLPQDQAQQVLDRMAPVLAGRQAQMLSDARESWAQEAASDKEFGGARLQQNLAVARRAMDAFGTPALKELLNASGLGNHPEVIRAFYRAGKAVSEDSMIRGTGGVAASDESMEKRLYPDM